MLTVRDGLIQLTTLALASLLLHQIQKEKSERIVKGDQERAGDKKS